MKSKLKNFLRNKDLYYRIKYSHLYNLYRFLFKRAALKAERKEIIFYRSFLPACNLVFDIGANDGHKTAAFLKIAGKVVCCEPDTENFSLLGVRFRKDTKRIFLENKALADKEGTAEYHMHHPGSAFNTISDKWVKLLENDNTGRWNERIKFTETKTVETTTLDRLIEKYGVPDFIKIDTEGAEQWVLKGLSRPVRYISFEVLLPEYAGEMKDCLAHINYLDAHAEYNISRFEELVFTDFVSKDELEKKLAANGLLSFDVIVKMST